MKLLVMAHREDETALFEKRNEKHFFTISYEGEKLTAENLDKVKGYEAVAVNAGCRVDEKMAAGLAERGVRYLLTRTAGTDHLDLEALKRAGIRTANVPAYAPSAISEHTVLLLLMLLRKMKKQIHCIDEKYFFLNGLRGRQISSLTVGVIGTGRIGSSTIRNLSGFGCRILAYDLYPNEQAGKHAQYVSQKQLLRESDAIILHCPLTAENHYLINGKTIAEMKPGVILVNTARGPLVDTGAVYRALESGKISAFGMDVYERENETQRKDYRNKELDDPLLAKLLAMEQVIFTTHTAFYTEEAIGEIIGITLENLAEFIECGSCKNER